MRNKYLIFLCLLLSSGGCNTLKRVIGPKDKAPSQSSYSLPSDAPLPSIPAGYKLLKFSGLVPLPVTVISLSGDCQDASSITVWIKPTSNDSWGEVSNDYVGLHYAFDQTSAIGPNIRLINTQSLPATALNDPQHGWVYVIYVTVPDVRGASLY